MILSLFRPGAEVARLRAENASLKLQNASLQSEIDNLIAGALGKVMALTADRRAERMRGRDAGGRFAS
jgi:hypothetical protein